jgi:hypothetical protein
MADIPTFLYVGSTTLNGANGAIRSEPGVAVLGGFFLIGYNRERYARAVGGPATYTPWWDGNAGKPNHEGSSNEGQFQVGAGASTTVIPLKLGALAEDYTGKVLKVDASSTGAYDTETSVIQSQTATSVTVSPAFTGALAEDDVVHIETGAWKTYRVIANDNQLTASPDRLGDGGDNWSTPVGAFGPSIELMSSLAEQYPTAPNFRVMKMAFNGGLAAFNAGASWSTFDAESTKAMSAEFFGHDNSDTPTYAGIVIDFAVDDIFAKSTTWLADIAAVVAALQAKFGATVPIWFVNPPEGIWSESVFTADGFTPYSRGVRYGSTLAASFSSTVMVLDASTCELNAEPDADGTDEPDSYSVGGTLRMGKLIATAIEAYNTAAPAVTPGTGLATYFLIGDSQGVGTTPFEAILQSGQPSLLGESEGSYIRAGQWIYSSQTGQFELYDVSANDNANGSPASTFAGPSASMLRALGATHSDGVLLIKVAKGGATFTEEGATFHGLGTFDPTVSAGLWDDLSAVFAAALQRGYGQLERSIDVRGFSIVLTDNDISAGTAAVAALQARLGQTLQEIRNQFTTRTDWVMPIVAVRPPNHVDNGGTAAVGTEVDRSAVRALWDSTAAGDSNLALINVDDLELQYDRLHYGSEANLILGTRLATQLLSMQSASGAAAGSGSGLTDQPAVDAPVAEVPAEDAASSGASITVAESNNIISTIDESIAQGGDVASYTVNGRTVTMRSLGELLEARRYFVAQTARAQGVRYTKMSFTR